ncbi:hypothetical protein ACFCW2_06685 [Qipengyuania sp. DSG2-2]|uniref:hypothetical protein n=1 Tax=Qipengyuania sp. DGS2-2 TaxID=3349631 RepID=UPI0036D3E6BE
MSDTYRKASDFFGDKLYQSRARQALPLLVRQAEARATIYYADLAEELRMPNPRNLNYVLGCVGTGLEALARDTGRSIPHIQALVVNQGSDTPGDGFDAFLREAGETWETEEDRWAILETYWDRIRNYPHWGWVLSELNIGRVVSNIDEKLEAVGNTQRGGEGPEHKALKEFVRTHPLMVGLPSECGEGNAEYLLPSGDRVDVVFVRNGSLDCFEVKPIGASDLDVVRGLFQCVKYAAVAEAQETFRQNGIEVSAQLVLGGKLPTSLVPLRNSLGVKVWEEVGRS